MKQYASAFIFLTCLLATGCESQEQIELARQRQADADANTCKSYGLKPGSEAFGNCRLQLDLSRQQPRYYYDPYPIYYGGGYYRRW